MRSHLLYSFVLLLEAYLVGFTIKIGVHEFAIYGTAGIIAGLAITAAVLVYGLFLAYQIIYQGGIAVFADHPAINFLVMIPASAFSIPVFSLQFFYAYQWLYPASQEVFRASPFVHITVENVFFILKIFLLTSFAVGSTWLTVRTDSSRKWLWLSITWLCIFGAFRQTTFYYSQLPDGGHYLRGVIIILQFWPPDWAGALGPLVASEFVYAFTKRTIEKAEQGAAANP